MKKIDPQSCIRGLLNRDRRMLAKTITLIESSLRADHEKARVILDAILPYTGKAVRLGITGVPGAGKSRFIESFGTMLCQRGQYVAVLAVDPSSPKTGGSILADKTRMEKLAVNDRAFIRPSPSGKTLGGVARKTRETMLLCEAAGFDVVMIETVGVGQSEVTVASMVDFFLVLMIAGGGDELQGIKKGVLELADAVAINKADGDNVERANRARSQYEIAFHLLSTSSGDWKPPVVTCSAVTMAGLDNILKIIFEHRETLLRNNEFAKKRRQQDKDWLLFLLREGLEEWFYENTTVAGLLQQMMQEVDEGVRTPASAAAKILSCLPRDCTQSD
jgi:LAO/AO transport system kinase